VIRKSEDGLILPTRIEVKAEIFDLFLPGIESNESILDSYVEFQEANSKFRRPEAIRNFIRQAEITSDKKDDFVTKVLDKLPIAEKPIGNDSQAKIANFLEKQKSSVVIRAIYQFKLEEEDDLLEQTKKDIKLVEKKGDKELSKELYPKKDGEYTKEALARFIFEKSICREHVYVDINIESIP
jgi:hypothetical protein